MTRSDATRRVRGIYAVTPDCAVDDALLERVAAILAGGFRPGMGQYLPDRFFWAREDGENGDE